MSDRDHLQERAPLRDAVSRRDWFAGQALANPAICTGSVAEYQLVRWFGSRTGITKPEIIAKQAYDYADAMVAEQEGGD